MFAGLPRLTQRPSSTPYRVPSTSRDTDPMRPGRCGASLLTPRSPPFQRIVEPAQSSPSYVIRTTAVPELSAAAAVTVAAFLTTAASLTPGPPPGDRTVNAATPAATASAARGGDAPA